MVLDLGVSANTAIIKRNKILTLDADIHDTWNLLNVFYLIIRSADADIVLTVYYHQYPGGGGRRCAAMCPCGKQKRVYNSRCGRMWNVRGGTGCVGEEMRKVGECDEEKFSVVVAAVVFTSNRSFHPTTSISNTLTDCQSWFFILRRDTHIIYYVVTVCETDKTKINTKYTTR